MPDTLSRTCVECGESWPCDATVRNVRDGIPHRLAVADHEKVDDCSHDLMPVRIIAGYSLCGSCDSWLSPRCVTPLIAPSPSIKGTPMTPEQIAAKGAFVRVLREYADRANDNYSGKVAVPEHVLRDAATCIEDQRAHIDTLTAAVPDAMTLGRAMDYVDAEDDALGVVGRGRKVDRIIAAYRAILNGETP